MLPSMRWHFLASPPDTGDVNMAFDEALMQRAASGIAVFRVYGWSSPTLSLGRNQRARGLYDVAAARRIGVGIVRRPTGGRALLHHREITYSATLPARDAASARAAYDFINGVLLGGLRRLGVDATLATDTVALPPGPRPCFDIPADREIVLGARKLVGSAQWRRNGALLQHGSILVRDDQPMIAGLLFDARQANPRAATVSEALGREPAADEVSAALRAALCAATGQPARDFEPDPVLLGEIDRLSRTYRDDGWTWRR
jgi:lipoate-protein ligase A